MKFTIESFKTHIYRPAEWMIENDKISHLIGDLTKQFLNERFSSYSSANGFIFKIIISTKSHIYEDENAILTVKFLNVTSGKNVKETSVVFEDNFETLVNKTDLPYWTSVTLLKKINALVFKVLTEMQEYEDEDTSPYCCRS